MTRGRSAERSRCHDGSLGRGRPRDSSTQAIERVGLARRRPGRSLSPALGRPAAAGVSRQGPGGRSPATCSSSTSRRPASTWTPKRRSPSSSSELHSGAVGVTILFVLARVRGGRAVRRAARARPRRHRLRRRRRTTLPASLARPLSRPCLTTSSCGYAFAAGAVVGLLAPAVGFFLVQRRDEPDRRRDRARRLRGRCGRATSLGISPVVDRARRRGRRRGRDRVAAVAAPDGRRPGARAPLLHRDCRQASS